MNVNGIRRTRIYGAAQVINLRQRGKARGHVLRKNNRWRQSQHA